MIARTRRAIRPWALSCLLLAVGCSYPLVQKGNIATPAVTTVVAPTLPVVLVGTLDARPPSGKASHSPVRSKMFGVVFGGYFAFGWERIDGAAVSGDENTVLSFGGQLGTPVEQVDRFVGRLVDRTIGASARRVPAAVDLANVDLVAATVPSEAFVIVPVLDQLDAFQMRTDRLLLGGGSSSTQNGSTVTTTTTSGYAADFGASAGYANLRLRLVVLTVRAQKVVQRSTVYAATTAADFPVAFARAAGVLNQGLAGQLGDAH